MGAYLFFYPFTFIMNFVALNITISLILEVRACVRDCGCACVRA